MGKTFNKGDIPSAGDFNGFVQGSDLSATAGAASVGSDDGASGSLWTTVAGFIAKIISSAGSSVVGFIQAGTGAVLQTVQAALRERVSVTQFGAATGTSASQSASFQAAIDAMYANGGGDVHVGPGTWRLDSLVTVKPNVRLIPDQYATFVHGANVNLFQMMPRSRFEGGQVDVSGTSLATFSSTVFDFDGTATSPNFRGVQPTVVRTEVIGRRGVGTGTAFHLHATGAASHVYGVQIDSTVDGLEIGAYLHNDDPGDGSRWVNGNSFRLRGIGTVNLIKQVTGVDGTSVDGNVFDIDYQTDAANTSTVAQIVGRYNTLRGMVWDYSQVPAAVTLSAGTSRNALSLHGVQTSQITDSGAANTIFTYTDGNPGLKVSALAQNSASTLNIVSNDVVMSNNKNLQWKESGGTVRSLVALSSGNNVNVGTSTNNLFLSGSTKLDVLIGGTNIAEFNSGGLKPLTDNAVSSGLATFRWTNVHSMAFTGYGAITSNSPSAGIGYATGAGGTVTQLTSKSTGVTLSKVSGQITMNNAALAAGAKVSFVVTNSAVAATDTPIVAVASGGTANAYRAEVTAVAAGSFTITVENITAGSLSESPVINFNVIKGVAA